MSGFVCLMERGEGGDVLAGLRLVGPDLDRRWTPPSAAPASDDEFDNQASQVLLAAEAADWIVDQLGRRRVLDRLAIDDTGCACSWLTLPGRDQRVVSAVVRQAQMHGGMEEDDPTVSSESNGAAALLSGVGVGEILGGGTARSVQPLSSARTSGAAENDGPARFGVVSAPDALAKVLIDHLDRRGVTVARVDTVWRMAAEALDPAGPAAQTPSVGGSPAGALAPVVESEATPSAVVLATPEGHGIWAWSLEGRPIAAGSFLVPVAHDAPDQDEDPEQYTGGPRLVFDTATGSRLALDWFAWGAQLGATPDRVVMLTPPVKTEPGADSPASLLAAALPGVTVDVMTERDPLGHVLSASARLADRDASPDAIADPEALPALTGRVGRQHKLLYRTVAAAFASIALVIAAFGWRMNNAEVKLSDALADRKLAFREKLIEAEPLAPGVSIDPAPQFLLTDEIARLREQLSALDAQKPVLPVVIEVLNAVGQFDDVAMTELTLTRFIVICQTGADDSETGPRLVEALSRAGTPVRWSGSTPTRPQAGKEYGYTVQGQWLEPDEENGP